MIIESESYTPSEIVEDTSTTLPIYIKPKKTKITNKSIPLKSDVTELIEEKNGLFNALLDHLEFLKRIFTPETPVTIKSKYEELIGENNDCPLELILDQDDLFNELQSRNIYLIK